MRTTGLQGGSCARHTFFSVAVGGQGGVHGQHILAKVAVNITIEEGGEGKRVREVYRTQGAGLTMACSPPASLLRSTG